MAHTASADSWGALATAYDHALGSTYPLTHDREYSEDEMWKNLEYWIKIITPIAEEEGIRLGIHPCDPPVESLGGIPDYSVALNHISVLLRFIQVTQTELNSVKAHSRK